MKKTNHNFAIGVVSINGKSGMTPLSHLIKILISFSKDLILITGQDGSDYYKKNHNVHVHQINHEAGRTVILRILRYIYTQLRITLGIIIFRKKINMWIFFIGGDTLILPMLIAKILRKKVLLVFAGSSIKTLSASNDSFYRYVAILSKINCILSNNIVLYSERLIQEWGLENHKGKIVIMHRHFINFDKFKILTEFSKRDNIIGYIGRLSREKGVEEFLKSIPELIRIYPELEFVICGDGYLKHEIIRYLDDKNLNSKVKLIPWVSHQEIPSILNKLKLLVLPSYTEGLPNIILESMACGTPVLTTSVGAIPDVILNNGSGFILEDRSSVCITKNIINFIKFERKEKIIKNSLKIIEQDYNYEVVQQMWKTFFEEI